MSVLSVPNLVFYSLLSIFSTLVCLKAVWSLVAFLVFSDTSSTINDKVDGQLPILLNDVMVMLIFIAQHSLMATDKWKSIVKLFGLSVIERLVYVLATSITLEFVVLHWQRTSVAIWHLDVSGSAILWGSFYGFHFIIWSLLFGSMFLIDVNELLGLKQVYYYWKGYDSPLQLKSHGQQRLFKDMRHPGLACFILLLIVHPHMSLDRLLLLAIMIVYMILRFDVDKEDHSYLEQSFLTKRDELGHNYEERLEELSLSVTRLYQRTFTSSSSSSD